MTICLCIAVWLLHVWPLHVYMFNVFLFLPTCSNLTVISCLYSFISIAKISFFWYCVIICTFSWARMWLNDSACGPSIPRSPWSTKMNTATMFSDLIILLSSKVGLQTFFKKAGSAQPVARQLLICMGGCVDVTYLLSVRNSIQWTNAAVNQVSIVVKCSYHNMQCYNLKKKYSYQSS